MEGWKNHKCVQSYVPCDTVTQTTYKSQWLNIIKSMFLSTTHPKLISQGLCFMSSLRISVWQWCHHPVAANMQHPLTAWWWIRHPHLEWCTSFPLTSFARTSRMTPTNYKGPMKWTLLCWHKEKRTWYKWALEVKQLINTMCYIQ